jgi:hypothetical protein
LVIDQREMRMFGGCIVQVRHYAPAGIRGSGHSAWMVGRGIRGKFVLSHPWRKNRDAPRMGHPLFVGPRLGGPQVDGAYFEALH